MPFGKRRQNLFDNGTGKYPNAREVKISVMFTRLAEIDTINERFSCEATLFITWRESSNMLQKCDNNDDTSYYWDSKNFWDPQLYIDNAIGDVKEKDVKFRLERIFDSEKNDWYFEVHMIKRIQGTFFEKLELYHFPFDVQDLSITLTSHRTRDEINIVQDYKIPPKMTKSASLDKHIWKLYDHVNIKVHTIKNDLPPSSEYSNEEFEAACSHPAITMQCRVSRKPGYFIINCLLPTLMITLCVFFTFLMDYSRFQYRFSLLFTTMLTSITFRWAIHGRVLPTISYMTFLDVYCVSSIMIVFSAMVWHAVYLVLYKQDENLAERCDTYAMIVFAVVVILIHIMQTIWFVIAFRKRLELENLDKKAATNYINAKMGMNGLSLNNKTMLTKAPSLKDQTNVILNGGANANQSLSNTLPTYTNSIQSKRMLYSFSKLDEKSIITVNNKNQERDVQNSESSLTTVKRSTTSILLAANQNNNLMVTTTNSTPGVNSNTNKNGSSKSLQNHHLASSSSNCYIDQPADNDYQYIPLVHQSSRDS